MVRSQQILARSTATEDFRWAARAAEAEIGRRVWWELSMTERPRQSIGTCKRSTWHERRNDMRKTAGRFSDDTPGLFFASLGQRVQPFGDLGLLQLPVRASQ